MDINILITIIFYVCQSYLFSYSKTKIKVLTEWW